MNHGEQSIKSQMSQYMKCHFLFRTSRLFSTSLLMGCLCLYNNYLEYEIILIYINCCSTKKWRSNKYLGPKKVKIMRPSIREKMG